MYYDFVSILLFEDDMIFIYVCQFSTIKKWTNEISGWKLSGNYGWININVSAGMLIPENNWFDLHTLAW